LSAKDAKGRQVRPLVQTCAPFRIRLSAKGAKGRQVRLLVQTCAPFAPFADESAGE
jgi:hypothetical protein